MEAIDDLAADSFRAAVKEIQLELKVNPTKGEVLLSEPYFFAEIPQGFKSEGELLMGNGGVLSTFNYGALWSGEAKDRKPTRGDLRTAFEWGANLLTFILGWKDKYKGA
jgi:hypothetical protein